MKNRKKVTYTHTQQTIDAFNSGTLRTIGGQPVTSRRVLDTTPTSHVMTSRAHDAIQRSQGHSVAQPAQPAAPMLSRSQEAVLRMAQATPHQAAATSSGSVVVSRAQEALARMAGGDK